VIRILAASSPGEVRVAALGDGVLQDYAVWRPGRPDGVSDVYRARVTAHVPGMAGAFLALPDGDGFLPDSEGGAGAVEGTLLTVRVTRAGQGGKGKRLTAKLPQSPGEPGLVARGPSPIEEYASRYLDATVTVDDPALAAQLRPALGERIMTVFAAFDDALADQIAALSTRELALPGGMRASIHPTPALVAIDLDMGAATAGRQPKPAAQFAANQAAMPELARQIRLRNLSGAILIDPAGMSSKRRALLGPTLAAALAADPLRPRFLGFTALGLAEVARPRVRPPLHELLTGAYAAGLAALRAIARESAATPHATWRLTAAPDVTEALGRDSVALADLARRTGRALIPEPDPNQAAGSWRIERLA
jgi:Ribonuclease G/E